MQRFWLLTYSLLLCASLAASAQTTAADRTLAEAERWIGVRELRPNRGPQIDAWNREAGAPLGSSYCASFGTHDLNVAQAEYPRTRSALARAYKREGILAKDVLIGKIIPQPGWLVGWQRGSTIHGHLAVVRRWDRVSGATVEGNTSSGVAGSQHDGDGVFARDRAIEPANYFRITWFNEVR